MILWWKPLLAFAVAASCWTGSGASAAEAGNTSPLVDPFPSTYKPLPRKDTFIAHATILDGTGGEIEDRGILLRDGKVVAIGAALTPPRGAAVIEAHHRWVTPGIIDVHSHLGDFAAPLTLQDLKVSNVNESTSPNTAQVWALHSIRVQDPQFSRALAGGVTTLQILPVSTNLFGGREVVIKNVPAVTIQEMEFPGAMPSLKMACGENPKYAYGEKGVFPSSDSSGVCVMMHSDIPLSGERLNLDAAMAIGAGRRPRRLGWRSAAAGDFARSSCGARQTDVTR